MRRLSMKGKNRKSQVISDSESGENGVAAVIARGSDTDERDSESESMRTPKRSVKTRSKRSRGKQSEENAEESNEDAQTLEKDQQENGNGKRRKKEEQAVASTSKHNTEEEYEVQKIVAYRTIKGRRQFLIRWKGYGEDSDTWEQEKDLNCSELIEEFLSENRDSDNSETPATTPKTRDQKTEKKTKKSNSGKKGYSEREVKSGSGNSSNDGDSKEFEVEKILEVYFKKNKTREFLIRWKGFSSADDSWEPEKNLNCPDLISKFMEKVEKARETEVRELRTNPAHTKRYTLTTHDYRRRISRRNMDKQRATYHQCDE